VLSYVITTAFRFFLPLFVHIVFKNEFIQQQLWVSLFFCGGLFVTKDLGRKNKRKEGTRESLPFPPNICFSLRFFMVVGLAHKKGKEGV